MDCCVRIIVDRDESMSPNLALGTTAYRDVALVRGKPYAFTYRLGHEECVA